MRPRPRHSPSGCLSRPAVLFALLALAGCDDGRKKDDDWKPITFGGSEKGGGPATLRPDGAPTGKPGQPAPGPAPAGPVTNDPLNTNDKAHMRQRAQQVLTKLIGALGSKEQPLVQHVPLQFDGRRGEVNAFAACVNKRAIMSISDDLMHIQAGLARAQAHDEVFRTKKLPEYLDLVAKTRGPGRAVPDLPRGFFSPANDSDARKVSRQNVLFGEELAFVLGHELAHHYLSHTGCIGADATALTPADLARTLARGAPIFNQPNELAADLYGTHDALSAGFTEKGGLLTLQFFRAMRGGNPQARFSFEDTHPDPNIRIPVVEKAADAYRTSGGAPLPVLALPVLK